MEIEETVWSSPNGPQFEVTFWRLPNGEVDEYTVSFQGVPAQLTPLEDQKLRNDLFRDYESEAEAKVGGER